MCCTGCSSSVIFHSLSFAVEGVVCSALETSDGGLSSPAFGCEVLAEGGGARGALEGAETEHVDV